VKRGTTKATHKYKSKKLVAGKWVYEYHEKKPRQKPSEKPKVRDYYGPGRHKYFQTVAEKKQFEEMQAKGMTGRGGKIKSTSGRLTIGTKVIVPIGGSQYEGKIVSSDGTESKSPTKFVVEYENPRTRKRIRVTLPRIQVKRSGKSWSEKRQERGVRAETKLVVREKTLAASKEMKEDSRRILTQDVDDAIKVQAKELVEANWGLFEKMVGRYYQHRVRGGWNASNFGFDEEDLKQEAFLVIYNSAVSYLTNETRSKVSFVNYTKSFLKANLASKLAAGSGAGGHLKASVKDQMYLWFFKDTLDEERAKRGGAIPSDVEMIEALETKRQSLPDEKGNRTIKAYKWTLEKVRNKKSMTKKMAALDKTIVTGEGTADTLMNILNDEEIETFGHIRMDPWREAQKVIVRDGVIDAVKRKVKSMVDRTILIRMYGLFVDEDSPQEVRNYAQGQDAREIAKILNRYEKKRDSLRRWNPSMVEKRATELLRRLKNDKDFKKQMVDFVKAKDDPALREWSDAANIMYWIACYQCVSQAVDEIRLPIVIMPDESPDSVSVETLVVKNAGIAEEVAERYNYNPYEHSMPGKKPIIKVSPAEKGKLSLVIAR